jgi:hypothetical protein
LYTDKELYRHGVSKFGIVFYRLKALEIRPAENGLWFKRIRIYHPIALLVLLGTVVMSPFIVLFGEFSIKELFGELYAEFIKGVKTT